MRKIICLIVVAVGIALAINAKRTEEAEWRERIQLSNEAGKQWEESRHTFGQSSTTLGQE
jgi:hypothetical protein